MQQDINKAEGWDTEFSKWGLLNLPGASIHQHKCLPLCPKAQPVAFCTLYCPLLLIVLFLGFGMVNCCSI